ncbi:ethionine resistance protein [Coemansia pectinata]|uniref:Ethionine resistance protein n=1 Tax=Coemansia pectinata TaxID=1052879 RepID=A0A9W8H1X5_9FUNG|nr:ethionine resistance protein [Coemansia pectinata]
MNSQTYGGGGESGNGSYDRDRVGITDDAAPHRQWISEARYQIAKALPMAVAGSIRSATSVIELRALGHIGSRPLAGRSLALLVVNLTGYPFMYGLGGALESLCSQAFTGAQGNKRIGVYVQHAIWIFLAANALIAILWLHPEVVFQMLAKPDDTVLHYARTYLIFECVYFPCIVVQTCLKRFLLAQGLMRPTVVFEAAGLCAMYASLWLFVWNPATSLGFVGVPLASAIAYAVVLLVTVLYITLAPCRSEWGPFTSAGFRDNARHIINLGVPCSVSGVASYGFADLATIAVSALGAESLATQAVLNSSKSALSRVGSYLGMVVSNRVGNLLGAQRPQQAFLSAKVCVVMMLAVSSVLAMLMLLCQRALAAFITNDEMLVLRLLPLIPLLVIVVVFDVVSNVLTGVLRGQGRQGVAAIVRVVSLYLFAVPLAYMLCFWLDLGLYGLWVGLAAGFVTISAAEGWLVLTSDWEDEAKRCLVRVNGVKRATQIDSPLGESSPLLSAQRSSLC